MHNKHLIQKLLKIANNQQKIITKLAQDLQALPVADRPVINEEKVIVDAMGGKIGPNMAIVEISVVEKDGGTVLVRLNHDKDVQTLQAAVNDLLRTMQKLTNEGKLTRSLQLEQA